MEDPKLKDSDYYKEFFGARKETIMRLKNLYGYAYFNENKKLIAKRCMMYQQEFARLNSCLGAKNSGRVLDIGCGTGNFLTLFDERWEKYGIEVSEHARQIAEGKGIITDFKLEDDFFDIIIFRGTLQHIPDPIKKISESYYWLKEKGWLVFLATPNTNSIYYKLFNTLPMLDETYNFLLPSDIMLRQILTNFGFRVRRFEYPYKGTPYARPARDLFCCFLKLSKVRKDVKFPFYKNMMECYAQKSSV